MEEKKELSIIEKARLFEEYQNIPEKSKKLKLMRKAKVKKGKIKKGWIGILKVDENNNISGEKQMIEDSSLRLKDGTYHATDGREILMWEGKFPVVIQSTKKINPVDFNINQGENQTYGQKYIMARMLKDAIKFKSKMGGLIIWIVLGIAAVIAFNYFFGNKPV